VHDADREQDAVREHYAERHSTSGGLP
jgi:hypothetical protein